MARTGARRSGRARRAAAALVALALGAAAAEGALRVLADRHAGLRTLLHHPADAQPFDRARTTRELLELSPSGFRPAELFGDFVTSSRGFRTPEYADEKAPGTYRVVALGDSFTFSSGPIPYERHWTRVLERGLDERAEGVDVELVNLGVSAIGPAFQLRLWELEGRRLAPDLVVLAFYVGNDFTDHGGAAAAPGPWSALVRRSYVARLARNLARAVRASPEGRAPERPRPARRLPVAGVPAAEALPGFRSDYDPARPVLSAEAFAAVEARRLALVDPEAEILARAFPRVSATLAELVREVRATGAEIAVLVLPDAFQVHPETLAAAAAERGTSPERLDLDAPQRRLVAFLEELAVPTLDLLPAFREHAAGGALYGVHDTHWNARGNRLAGELAVPFLAPLVRRDLGLGPPAAAGLGRAGEEE